MHTAREAVYQGGFFAAGVVKLVQRIAAAYQHMAGLGALVEAAEFLLKLIAPKLVHAAV